MFVQSVSQTDDSGSDVLGSAGKETSTGDGMKLRNTDLLSKNMQLLKEKVFYCFVYASAM